MRFLATWTLSAYIILAEILIKDVDKLVDRLTFDAIGQSDTYSQALTIIESYRSAPSCHRLAATDLVQACEAITPDANVETMVQETRELFAVRLAICELDAAQDNPSSMIPAACIGFYSTTCTQTSTSWIKSWQQSENQMTFTEKPCFPAVSQKQLRACMTALRGQPQSWTSYSNALQNVAVVCQATRNAREKDELLNVHRAMAQANQGLQTAYETVLHQGMEFTHAVHEMQSKLVDEARRGVESLRDDAAQAGNEMRGLFTGFWQDLSRMGESFSTALNRWNEQAKKASESASEISAHMATADQDALALSRNMQVVAYHAIDLQGVLVDMLDKVDRTNAQMQTVAAMHESVTNSLNNSTAEIEKIVAKHSHGHRHQVDFRTMAILLIATAMITHYAPLVGIRLIVPLCVTGFVGYELYTLVLQVEPCSVLQLLR